ncbi:MAG: hypothetical protein WCS27_15835 [Victivallaceae bacterium]
MRKFLFIFLSVLFVFQVAAATLRCSVCGKKIKGRYLKADGKVFCSQKCFDQTKPICAVCGKRCTKGAYKKDDKYYCSKKCLETTLPKCALCGKPFRQGIVIKTPEGDKVYCEHCGALPKCFVCGLPAASGTYLKDGRFLGANCGKTAIFSEDEAKKLFDEIRSRIAKDLNWSTKHRIHLRLVDLNTLKKASANYEPGMEMGLYKYTYTVKTKTEKTYSLLKGHQEKTEVKKTNNRYSILILNGLPEWKFVEVCAHELGHDWMQENYPKIKDLKVKEGWAEYFASRVNEIYGREYLNKRMESNPSKIYGDGYRFIRDYVKRYGMHGLMRHFWSFDK